MEKSQIWFSHKELRYEADLKDESHIFHWTDSLEVWDWDNCKISAIKAQDDEISVIVRSSNIVYSKYKKSDVELRYFFSFDVIDIHEPQSDNYPQPVENTKGKRYGSPKQRWVFQLDDDYWIWQWAQDGEKIQNSQIWKIYDMLIAKKNSLSIDNILDVPDLTSDENKIIPVIYQPSLDSWKNFLREVHCCKVNDEELEVTLLFNNEHLREHAILNPIYEWFRGLIYGRVIDVETFHILLKKELPENFQFKGIYSGKNNIYKDDIHQENEPPVFRKIPTHQIEYYFVNNRHPIVFINTANHAMAERDTNSRLWKWEYVTWEKNTSIVYGEKSRKEIDESFKPKIKF